MKEILKSKVMRLFIALVFAFTIIHAEDTKKASATNTDNKVISEINYTSSVTQK